MASFAKAQLMKYGWTEGKGLGKNENGIVDAIKPKLKFDNTGVGHDSKEFKWWESVYDKASDNVMINAPTKENNKISMSLKDQDAIEISTDRLSMKKLAKTHNLQYGNFLKTCTLDSGKVVREKNLEKINIDAIVNETASIALTDEQLFRACGGRTGHKGARHGLKLGGKLARIAQQEAQLLGNMLDKKIEKTHEDWTEVKNKKKNKSERRKRRRSLAEIDSSIINEDSNELIDANANNLELAEDESSSTFTNEPIASTSYDVRKKSKNAKRKEKRCFQALASKLNAFSLIDDDENAEEKEEEKKIEKNSTKKRKKEKSKSTATGKLEEEIVANETATLKLENSKKSIKRKNRPETTTSCMTEKIDKFPNEKTHEMFDGSIIILDDEANNDDPDNDESRQLTRKRRKVETTRKKRKSMAKSEKKRVERLSDCLMAVNLSEDSVDSGRGEDLIFNCEITRKLKKWKKCKKEKRERKIEENINHDGQI